jgi:hypothetical protein
MRNDSEKGCEQKKFSRQEVQDNREEHEVRGVRPLCGTKTCRRDGSKPPFGRATEEFDVEWFADDLQTFGVE